MSLVLDGSTDALKMSAALSLSYPYTICAWIKPPNNTQDRTVVNASIALSAINFSWLDANAANVRWANRFVGTDSFASDAGITANVWQSVIGSAISATSKKAWWGGGAGTEETTNTGAVPAFDTFIIGAAERGSGVERFFSGRIAAVSVHAYTWTDALAAEHAAGADPSKMPGCTHFFMLNDGKLDSVGSWSLTDVGTPTYDASDNPTIRYEAMNPWAMAMPIWRPPAVRLYDSKRFWRR